MSFDEDITGLDEYSRFDTNGFEQNSMALDSLIRPADAEDYGHGMTSAASSYKRREMMLSEQEAKARDRAEAELRASMVKNAPVSTSQGLAAALIAAIPAIGGPLLARGTQTQVPNGVYGADLKPTGPGFVGSLGAKSGADAATSYFDQLQAEQDQKNLVHQQLAQSEIKRADALENDKNQIIGAGLNNEAQTEQTMLRDRLDRERIPLEQAAQLAAQKEIIGYKDSLESLSQEQIDAVNKALGLPEGTKSTPAQLRVITQAVESARKRDQGDMRLAGENLTVPSVATKQAMENYYNAKDLTDRYLGKLKEVAKNDPSLARRTIESALPQTEIGQLQRDLELFSVQIRNAREAGIMTEPDFQRYSAYLKIGKLDTIESVTKRLQELKATADISARARLKSAKLGRENVTEYERDLGIGGGAQRQAPPGFDPSDPGYIAWKASRGQ